MNEKLRDDLDFIRKAVMSIVGNKRPEIALLAANVVYLANVVEQLLGDAPDNYERGYELWCALMRARGWVNVGDAPSDVDELWQEVARLQSEPDYCLPPTRWYVNPAAVEQLSTIARRAADYITSSPACSETCGEANELARAIIEWHNRLRAHTIAQLPF